MDRFLFSLLALLVVPFLLPEEFISWSRSIRRRLRDDLRRRVSPEEWEEYQEEFCDL
jgi:hypothetical protein